MKRRTFIKGAVAVAVSAALPGGDGVALNSVAHPTPALLPFVSDTDTGIFSTSGDKLELVSGGVRMAKALAESMKQTREVIAANVLNNIFPEYEYRTFHTGTLEEIEVDIKRGGSTDE